MDGYSSSSVSDDEYSYRKHKGTVPATTTTTDANKRRKKRKLPPQQTINRIWKRFDNKRFNKALAVLPFDPVLPPTTSERPNDDLLSAGYERAAGECRQRVKKIIQECQRVNMRYRDPGWDIDWDLKMEENHCLNTLGRTHFNLSMSSGLTHNPNGEDFERVYSEMSYKALFAQSETCVPLIEKAYTKARSNNPSFSGGWIGEGLEDPFGSVTTELLASDNLDHNGLWENKPSNINEEFLSKYSIGLFAGEYGDVPTDMEQLASDILDLDRLWEAKPGSIPKEFLFECNTGLLDGGYGDGGLSECLAEWQRIHNLYRAVCKYLEKPRKDTENLKRRADWIEKASRIERQELIHEGSPGSVLRRVSPTWKGGTLGRFALATAFCSGAIIPVATAQQQHAVPDPILHFALGTSIAASGAIPPLRGNDNISPNYWLGACGTWGAAFLTLFVLELVRRPDGLQRRLLGGTVLFTALNLLGTLSQSADSVMDGILNWGPIALTASLCVVPVLMDYMSPRAAAETAGNMVGVHIPRQN